MHGTSPSPHDALFKSAFKDPKDAAKLLQNVLDEPIAHAIDWSTLRPEPGSYIDETLAERHSDLLFSASIGGEDAYVYLLIEHQSTVDRDMPLRMLVYLTRVWLRHRSAHPGRDLPPILPVVVSHAPGGWTAPVTFESLVRPGPTDLPELTPHIPRFELVINDLTHLSDQQLREWSMRGFATLVLWILRTRHEIPELIDGVSTWRDMFREVFEAPDGVQAMTKIFHYIACIAQRVQVQEFHAKLDEHVPQTREVMKTYYEELMEEGMAKGLAKGREEGREQSRIETLQETLIDLLSAKFDLRELEHAERIRSANEARLRRYITRILTAETVEAVFDESEPAPAD
ncbi:hypothetical protein PPSIR1_27353 [Plesiocystis pacifica SIR-1]|uniref:Transposase (putative) YhgA-like domain-containing protein n=1 Tax=Plesiocystis pacifica SIR-1 TaxID=391625 RepID=A6G4N5_9BACT|nr:Rpn family recombination-promoting nuclease/putative transposase [Plesiocystis pacifica]EDM79155.1 hypothetical protein PPSIR1_27353 [Plesiocystis pacifica SIR-1]